MVIFACTHCRQPLQVRDHQAGTPVRCPRCKNAVSIPSAAAAQPTRQDTPPPAAIPVQRPSPDPDLCESSSTKATIRVPGYEIIRELGRGGMGVVYEAVQAKLRRTVALKMILAGGHAGSEEMERFRTEAQALALLKHPHIVQIHELGEHEGKPFFSLELVEGGSLAHRLAEGPLPVLQAVELMTQLADAMEAVHQLDVIHRDLKPANILLTARGEAKITDFGLAKILNEVVQQTRTGKIMGTPAYMAPEQAAGKIQQISPLTDVYALGAIFYECLTGQTLFAGPVELVLFNVIYTDPHPPRKVASWVPRDVETICLKCLEKNPRHRYQSASMLADDIGRWLRNEPIQARPVGRVEKLIKWARRRPAMAGVVILGPMVALFGLLGLVALLAWYQTETARQQTEEAKERAEAARQDAVGAQKLAEARGREVEQARDQLEKLSYVHHMNVVQRDWKAGNVVRARQLLKRWPAEWRQWEWHFLNTRCSPEPHILRGHQEPVMGVAFSPDGRWLASGSEDHLVKVWDVATGKEIWSLEGHDQRVADVAFSPDSQLLASASKDGTVRIWDVATGEERKVLRGHTTGVVRVKFSPTEPRLASAGHDSTIRIWDATNWEPFRELHGHTQMISCLAYRPDGLRLASGGFDHTVRTWDARTGQAIWTVQEKRQVAALAYSPDGKRLALSTTDPTIRILDASSGKKTRALPGHTSLVPELAFSPDGTSLASVSHDRTVKVWDLWNGTSRTFHGHTDKVMAVAFSPNGRDLASAGVDETVRIWDALGGEPTLDLLVDNYVVKGVAFSPDGKWMTIGGGEGRMRVLAVADGRVIHDCAGHNGIITAVVYRPDGQQIASASQDGDIKLWDAESGEERFSFNEKGHIYGLAYSPDNRHLAVTCGDGKVSIWDVKKTQRVRELCGHTSSVVEVAYSPDSQRVISVSFDRTVRVWDPVKGTELLCLKGHSSSLLTLARSPDGTQLATAGMDQKVNLWDGKSGRLMRSLVGHTSEIESVAYSPDGNRLATGGSDYTVKLWDVHSGEELLSIQLSPTDGTAEQVAFSPDGRRLAVATRGGMVRLWFASETPQERQRRRLVRVISEIQHREKNKQWYAAAFHLKELLEGQKRGSLSFRVRLHRAQGMHWAQRRNWKKAVEAFHEAVDLAPKNVLLRRHLALALLAGNDNAGYQEACAKALEVFATAPDKVRSVIVHAAVIHPAAVRDTSVLVRFAARLKRSPPDADWFGFCYGAALYRAGRYRQACSLLESSQRTLSGETAIEARFFLAMAYQQLGQPDKAQTWLDKANHSYQDLQKQAREPGPSPQRSKVKELDWDSWVVLDFLHREAEQTLAHKGTPKKSVD